MNMNRDLMRRTGRAGSHIEIGAKMLKTEDIREEAKKKNAL